MSNDELPLKAITRESVSKAIDKADHYRLLNEPEEAESICEDVLAIEPGNQRAVRTLVLALTDQFGNAGSVNQAKQYAQRLTDEYERAYYTGIVFERQARAQLRSVTGANDAHDDFRDAMAWYEKAEQLRPAGNDDALLRWNSCVRSIRRHRLQPAPVHAPAVEGE